MQPGLCLSEKSKEPWLYSATVRPPIPLISKKPLEVQACWRCDGLKVSMLKPNLRSGVPYIFCRGGKVRLIQILDYLSVSSPESGLFSDWSRNKKVLRTEP